MIVILPYCRTAGNLAILPRQGRATRPGALTRQSDAVISIRIGRKAMTLGGDSSKAAIARSSDIQVGID